MRNRSAFQRGRGGGAFTCGMCGKRTRHTGDNDGTSLCPVCNMIALCENSLSDNGWGKHGDLEHCQGKTVEYVEAEFTRLVKAAGGPT